ncbi:MAG TPA: hypothetical protein PLL20_03640 [Phycisphaerae bacterium]|nr:hypothetical protein [Phycisphaerae bacterium]
MDERTQMSGDSKGLPATMPAAQPVKRGLECPRCGCRHFHVLYTRATIGGRILRRRECRYCGRRVTTYESAN